MIDDPDHAGYAYQFFGHADAPMDPAARWLTGPSLDGRGQFGFADPAPALGQEPQLAKAPPSVHGGTEATRTSEEGEGSGMIDKVKDAVDKVT